MNSKRTGLVYFALLILVGLLISCSGSSENKKDAEKPTEREVAKVIKLEYDVLTTEVAKYIAGMDCEDERFKQLQDKSFYSEHYNFIESAWDRIVFISFFVLLNSHLIACLSGIVMLVLE